MFPLSLREAARGGVDLEDAKRFRNSFRTHKSRCVASIEGREEKGEKI